MRALRSCLALLYIESLNVISSTPASSFKSVNISYYVRGLYEQSANEAAPSVHDPVLSDPDARERICQDITGNGIFSKMRMTACNLKDWYFHDIFGSYIHHSGQLYSRRQFRLMVPVSSPFAEYVFPCLVKYSPDSAIVPFYVSKEYNVAPALLYHHWYKPGRFVLGNFQPTNHGHRFHDDFYVMLAEESASLYVGHNFNIEIHYLNTRKYIRPVEDKDVHIDPLCGLILGNRYDRSNQYVRLCMAVCTIFTYRYALDEEYFTCWREQISFRTAEGVSASAGGSYSERMTLCRCAHIYSIIRIREVYISRSYRSGQVLMYERDTSNGEIYLKSFSANISILDEVNSFDFVED